MDISPTRETNPSPPKRRETRSPSPSPTSAAPKKPRVSHGKLSVASDHADRLKNKRHSLAVESKKLSAAGDSGRKKRASFAGSLSSVRKLSSTGPAPMDVDSSSSDLEESEVRSLFRYFIFVVLVRLILVQ